MIKIKAAGVSVHAFGFHPRGLHLRWGFLQAPAAAPAPALRRAAPTGAEGQSWHRPAPCPLALSRDEILSQAPQHPRAGGEGMGKVLEAPLRGEEQARYY